jgi:hypothetical protein
VLTTIESDGLTGEKTLEEEERMMMNDNIMK